MSMSSWRCKEKEKEKGKETEPERERERERETPAEQMLRDESMKAGKRRPQDEAT